MICTPPATTIRPHQYVQLTELADYPHTGGTDAIDVMISFDYYRDIVSGDVIRGESPIAVHNKLTPVITSLALQGSHLSLT